MNVSREKPWTPMRLLSGALIGVIAMESVGCAVQAANANEPVGSTAEALDPGDQESPTPSGAQDSTGRAAM
jgi:hypothetical protein